MVYKRFIFTLGSLILLFFNTTLKAQTEDTTVLRNPEHLNNADQLVEDLRARLTLSDDQASEIREILIDYQENLGNNAREADGNFEDTDLSAEDPNLESESPESEEMNADTTGVNPDTDNDFNQSEDEIGITPDPETGSTQEAANLAIEEILNETQKTTWSIIRDAWWRDVNNRYGWGENRQEY